MEAGQRVWRDREQGQGGLFGEQLEEHEHAEAPLPNVPDWSRATSCRARRNCSGST